MIRTTVLCLTAVVVGMMVAKGDLKCRVSPESLDHLRGATSAVIQYGENQFTHSEAWGRATGDPTPLHGRADDHFQDRR